MDYKGVECPVCKKAFTDADDIVVCPDCGTPHHRACWFEISHCANIDKHADGFVFENPSRKKLEEVAGQVFNISAAEEKKSGEIPPVIQAPILGGMGQMGVEFGDNPTISDVPLNEAAAFVGEDPSSSKLLFKLTMIDRFKTVRLNFVTLFFPYLWFFYRKMYKVGALVIAFMLLTTVAFTNSKTIQYEMKASELYMQRMTGSISVEEFEASFEQLREQGTGNNYYYDVAPQFINYAIRIVLAIFANRIYLRHMKKQVLKTREECSSMGEYMASLRRKGGKSVGAAVLSVFIFGALNAATFYALYSFFM